MAETKNDGGPAYPACNEANVNGTMGMSLRDWFAGQALAGGWANNTKLMAERAYQLADAMLEARSK